MWKRLLVLLAVGESLCMEAGPTRSPPDRVEVVSSPLKVLPRRHRERRSALGWRKPRDYEFVTREGGRSPRRLPYPDEENYPPQDYFERRRDPPTRRIIYYASLPEVIRRPGEWTPPRPIYYPPPSHNEIVTRVQSGLIDVSNNNNNYNYNKYDVYNKYPDRYSEELPPRFTIIDAEPPYNRPPLPPPPGHFDRYDYRRQDYNRYDFRNHVEPYRAYYEPYRLQQLPAQPVTVVRRPLDVRPLHPLSTQAPPAPSGRPSTTTTTPSTTTTTTAQDLSTYERDFKTAS